MANQDRSIGFIGIGTLGKGLALALSLQGYRVTGAASRQLPSARWLADRVPGCRAFATPQELADATDLVFITTPDSAISPVAASVGWRRGQGVAHCCGAATADLLGPAAEQGAETGTFHPFQTFAGLEEPGQAVSRLSDVTFALSGSGWLPDYLAQMAVDLGGRGIRLPDGDRPLYHASAILSCGYLVALVRAAAELWRAMGFTEDQAVEAIYPLARATLENVRTRGLPDSVTGPLVRGDTEVIRSHLEVLATRVGELAPLYLELTRASLPLAQERGVDRERLADLEEIIELYRRRSGVCPK